jgi:hypothetical protein
MDVCFSSDYSRKPPLTLLWGLLLDLGFWLEPESRIRIPELAHKNIGVTM